MSLESLHFQFRLQQNFSQSQTEYLFNTLYIEIKHTKIFFGHNKRYKKCILFFIRALLLIHNFYISWSTRFVSLKACLGFSIFYSVSFLLKFMTMFTLCGYMSFRNDLCYRHAWCPYCYDACMMLSATQIEAIPLCSTHFRPIFQLLINHLYLKCNSSTGVFRIICL